MLVIGKSLREAVNLVPGADFTVLHRHQLLTAVSYFQWLTAAQFIVNGTKTSTVLSTVTVKSC